MKILVLSQHIFPMQTPRAHRTTELIKELALQGHNVTVYAVLGKYNYTEFEKQTKIKVKTIPIQLQKIPYSSDGNGKRAFIDKVLGKVLGKVLEFPNIEFMFNIPNIIKYETNVDMLISIADPHHIHWGCAKAKLKYPEKFPKLWVADCGDPFMANIKNKYHYHYYSKYEKLFCTFCDFVTVPVPEAIDAYYPEFRDKIKVIPQGFRFELPIATENEKINEIPTFIYAGIFYKDIRSPKKLFDYLSKLNFDFKFIVYTKYTDLIIPYAEFFGKKLEIRKPIDRDSLLEILKHADFLVNIENDNSPSQIPSKLIDYAIAGRPILSINNANFNSKIINEFLNGIYVSRYIVKNIEQYHIANVAKKFISLSNEK